MTTIQTTAHIGADRKLVLQLPTDVSPGDHPVTVVIGKPAEAKLTFSPDNWRVRDVGPWPAGLSLRREDLYGEDGR